MGRVHLRPLDPLHLETQEHLRVEELFVADRRADGGPEIPVEGLHAAVDVAHPETEDDPVHEAEHFAEGVAHKGIRALAAASRGKTMRLQERENLLQILGLKLSVGIHEGDDVFGGGVAAGADRSAIALIFLIMDDAQARVLFGKLIEQHSRAVARAIVHGDDLPCNPRPGEPVETRPERDGHVFLLVVTREDQ